LCNKAGTVNFSNMTAGNTNQTFGVGNSVNNTMTFTGNFPATGDLSTSFYAATNVSLFGVGCVNNPGLTNTLPGTMEGLLIYNNYGTNYTAAATGNDLRLTFTEPLCGLSFKVGDITALTLSSNFPGFGYGVYQDEVVIVGFDDLGDKVIPTITKIGSGYYYDQGGCIGGWNYFGGTVPAGSAGASQTVDAASGIAYTVAGATNPSVISNSTCYSGGNTVSMDIQVTFPAGVFIKKIKLTYRNHATNFLGKRRPNIYGCNSAGSDFMASQAIIVENMSYEGVGRSAISGYVGEDRTMDNTIDRPIKDVIVKLFADADNNGVADSNIPVMIDANDDGIVDNPASTFTSSTGYYAFNNVPAGIYVIKITQPSGFTTVTDVDLSTDLVTSPNDHPNNSGTDNLIPVNVRAGEIDTENDFVKRSVLLPVRLLNFMAQKTSAGNQLIWQTADEKNVKCFAIEKRLTTGNALWSTIAVRNATGANAQNNYQYVDIEQTTGIVYYRLKIIDLDGQSTYSDIVTLNNLSKEQNSISPNPLQSIATLQIGNKNLLHTQAKILNANGQYIKTISIQNSIEQLDLSTLNAGLYMIELSNGEILKFMKQ
jgi:Secretion system C-terminal sorting domain/SdrD B-like domain